MSIQCASERHSLFPFLRVLLILLLLLPLQSHAAGVRDPPVCRYRTVNYITHSLPQQCLRTSRTASSASTSSPALAESTGIPRTSKQSGAAGNQDLKKSTTAVDVPVSLPTATQEDDADSESPLGKDKFLSFEEWKKQNLDKYGQSSDQIGKPKKLDNIQPRLPPVHVLDSLGDDAEIDIDFTGFAAEKPQIAIPGHRDPSGEAPRRQNSQSEVPVPRSRSKDAGKTFKERFNYASFDCAATVLKTNSKSSGSSSVLVENKDSYMLNECSVEHKFIILELCADILIDTIVLANYEFFSSIFASFRLSVSDRYPVKADKWNVLGTFEARNTREIQAFLVENPMIWAKYVQIEFLTHYGKEFYCPISLVRVHGTTMLEDYRHEEERNKPGAREDDEEQQDSHSSANIAPVAETETPQNQPEVASVPKSGSSDAVKKSDVVADKATGQSHSGPLNGKTSADLLRLPLSRWSQNLTSNLNSLILEECEEQTSSVIPEQLQTQSTTPLPSPRATKTGKREYSSQPDSTSVQERKSSSTATVSQRTTDASPSGTSTHIKDTIDASATAKAMGSEGKPSGAAHIIPPPNPPVQESFFKSVQKRLQMLESNSTLSLQYIEEQSRILRDAFSKVEQRQLSKTTKFLDYLNGTVLAELRDFRKQYDQLWQSTVLELETQREQSQSEVESLDIRISILADELEFQKRMAILQIILVLICISLVLFPRSTVNGYLDHPLVQNMVTRSATLKMSRPFLDTPSMSPESTRPNSSYKATNKLGHDTSKSEFTATKPRHRRMLSVDSDLSNDNPSLNYLPPTPVSYDSRSHLENEGDEESLSHFSLAAEEPLRPNSSPPDFRSSIDEPSTPTQIKFDGSSVIRPSPSPSSSSVSSNNTSSQDSVEDLHKISASLSNG